MTITRFPPVDEADEDGLLAVGGDLEVESLLFAYRQGIYPWPISARGPIPWFCPPQRAVLFFNELTVPRSLAKFVRKQPYEITVDQHFDAVIENCARSKNRTGQRGTWITKEMIKAYCEFHRAGYAHSIEAHAQGKLVGGLYGVAIGGFFAGESMFYHQTNASKCCLLALIDLLQKRSVTWIDCQQLTPLFESFGAREIARSDFLKLLAAAQSRKIELF